MVYVWSRKASKCCRRLMQTFTRTILFPATFDVSDDLETDNVNPRYVNVNFRTNGTGDPEIKVCFSKSEGVSFNSVHNSYK